MSEDYGCKFGMPHDIRFLFENKVIKWEVCQICNKKFRWVKGFKGRVQNEEYLKIHIRNFAQKLGATKRVYYKVYHPERLKIFI